MKGKLLALSLFATFTATTVVAQQDKIITHFMFDKMSLNPGSTGIDKGICGVLMYRNQWDKVNGAPNSALLNIEANLDPYLRIGGIGISFFHDAIAFTRQNNLMLNYSYPLDLGFATLGIGVGVGITSLGMNPEWVPPTTLLDPTLPSAFSTMNMDLNFGLYLRSNTGPLDNGYYAGISSTHLTESPLTSIGSTPGTINTYNPARHYYVMGGYTFRGIGPGDLETNALIRTDLVKFSADINARYIWNNMAYGGLSYRVEDAVSIMLGWMPLPGASIGYAYDITTNRLSGVSKGTHEIMLKYCYYLPPIPIQKSKHPRWL
jgi:type IX secretion system PorP/SprF family membrane protein